MCVYLRDVVAGGFGPYLSHQTALGGTCGGRGFIRTWVPYLPACGRGCECVVVCVTLFCLAPRYHKRFSLSSKSGQHPPLRTGRQLEVIRGPTRIPESHVLGGWGGDSGRYRGRGSRSKVDGGSLPLYTLLPLGGTACVGTGKSVKTRYDAGQEMQGEWRQVQGVGQEVQGV